MDIKNGVVTKIYNSDCAYNEAIVPDRTTIIGSYSAHNITAKKVQLPNSITEIKEYAFLECENLEEINIPNSVTSIGERAFYGCKNLKRIVLPENLSYLGSSAFCGCENLEEIVLPKNLKDLNWRTFADCKRLKRVIIPEGVENISWGVFSGCENLEEIVLPNSIKKLDKQLFLNCKKLKNVVIPEHITFLPDEFFKGCKSLNIELNENITSLGNSVFENCIRQSKFPSNVISFGDNCFKNCRSLKDVILNEHLSSLPNSAFEGCSYLENITHPSKKSIKIGSSCFKNCRSLKSIPHFVTSYNISAFENCIGLTEITITDHNIPFACFRGCTNLKTINNQEGIYTIAPFAFSSCENLEEMDLIYVPTISAEAFSNCKKLVKVRLNLGVKKIDSRAFYGCEKLKDFNIPDSVEIINKEAFRHCNSIEQITIPTRLKSFGDAAFACMDSLETINVSPANKTFITPDNKILIDQMKQKLVLYASGCKDKSYSLKDYNVELDWFRHELIKPISYIGEYAFAGAKNLEELTLCGCSDDVEYTAFQDCPKLKKLNIEGISLFTCHGFKLRDHGRYYMSETAKQPLYIPFESVEYKGELVDISPNALQGFTNVTNITLPAEGSYSIGSNAFTDCKKLTKVFVPKNVKAIRQNAFHNSTTLEFNNGLKTNGLVELLQENEYSKYKALIDNIEKHKDDPAPNDGVHVKINLKGLIELTNSTHKYLLDYTLYTLDDDTFYVEQDDKITTISKQYIDKVCTHSEEIRNNPVLFVDFMNDLINNDIAIRPLFNGILMSKMNLHSRKLLVENFKKDDGFFLEILKASGVLDKSDDFTNFLLEHFEYVINKINILKKYNIKEPLLYHKLFMACVSDETFEELIKTDCDLFKQVIKDSELTKLTDIPRENLFSDPLYNNRNLGENLLAYINLIKGKKDKDKFLMNHLFITNDSPLCTKLIKNFDENLKRLLKASKILDGIVEKDMSQNFLDLLNLLEMTGGLEDDPITRQKACTFITEKIFDEKLPNGENNIFRIVGDDIHRIFNFGGTATEYNKEFATFFLENYRELHKNEKLHSGIIERIYKNFSDISRTCTSDKGSQRKLKVTMDKCISYLQTNKFDNVSKEHKELATLIGWWYDKNETWEKALMIYNESLKAPRNIFTKSTLDENGNVIYDNDPNNDLREEINENFSFEWLPKQDYDNLVLGKYCNCCAHVDGAGQGIMRASMILDDCQNLVIRNSMGIIIAKSTLYVNKEKGYAVFNNVESSINHRTPEELEKIYNAFIRGINTFVNVYNVNNIEIPITKVTIGANRNTILTHLENPKHPEVQILQSIKYGDYSINGWSGYNGDWSSKQRLVLKR
ncbi:MAG: leucine-rich repeat protein [Bacilli bacterium]|nr:leucine-rich repeat protein [Bacilli bacterium]